MYATTITSSRSSSRGTILSLEVWLGIARTLTLCRSSVPFEKKDPRNNTRYIALNQLLFPPFAPQSANTEQTHAIKPKTLRPICTHHRPNESLANGHVCSDYGDPEFNRSQQSSCSIVIKRVGGVGSVGEEHRIFRAKTNGKKQPRSLGGRTKKTWYNLLKIQC